MTADNYASSAPDGLTASELTALRVETEIGPAIHVDVDRAMRAGRRLKLRNLGARSMLAGIVVAGILIPTIRLHNAVNGPNTSSVATELTDAEVQRIQSVGYLLSTRLGATVHAVRISGGTARQEYLPGVTVNGDIGNDDLIVVVSTDSVPQTGRSYAPGETPTPVAMVRLVLDARDGRVVATTYIPESALKQQNLRDFGPTSKLLLTNISAPTT